MLNKILVNLIVLLTTARRTNEAIITVAVLSLLFPFKLSQEFF